MKIFDRLVVIVIAGGVWAMAAMYYQTEFRAGAKPNAPPPAQPASMAVVNDKDAPLKVTGAVDAAISRLNCALRGQIVTQKRNVRLFGPDNWQPDKEWPVELTLECK